MDLCYASVQKGHTKKIVQTKKVNKKKLLRKTFENGKSKRTSRGNFDREDIVLLEKVVENEAGGEPYEGKVAVVNVILNRMRSGKFPSTIREVIFQKGQFSKLNRALSLTPSDETKKAVYDALFNNKTVVPPDTYYFLNIKIAQDFTIPRTKEFVKRIGNHWFYRD